MFFWDRIYLWQYRSISCALAIYGSYITAKMDLLATPDFCHVKEKNYCCKLPPLILCSVLIIYYTSATHKTFFYTLCFTLWHKSRLLYMYHILHTSYSHVSAGKSPLQITLLGKAVILPQVVPKKMDWKCKQDMSDWIASMPLCPRYLNHTCHENFTHIENGKLSKYHCSSGLVDLLKNITKIHKRYCAEEQHEAVKW